MPGDKDLLLADIIQAVQDDECNLTEWEDEFIESIKDRDSLSDKQDAVLERIWKKATGRSG